MILHVFIEQNPDWKFDWGEEELYTAKFHEFLLLTQRRTKLVTTYPGVHLASIYWLRPDVDHADKTRVGDSQALAWNGVPTRSSEKSFTSYLRSQLWMSGGLAFANLSRGNFSLTEPRTVLYSADEGKSISGIALSPTTNVFSKPNAACSIPKKETHAHARKHIFNVDPLSEHAPSGINERFWTLFVMTNDTFRRPKNLLVTTDMWHWSSDT